MLNNGSGSVVPLARQVATGAAIGGVIAVAMSNNATLADIDGTTNQQRQFGDGAGVNGGSETVVAMAWGIVIEFGVAVGLGRHHHRQRQRRIESSTITGQASGVNRALEVDADQMMNIAIGARLCSIFRAVRPASASGDLASIAHPGVKTRPTRISAARRLQLRQPLVMADSASVIAAGAASGGGGASANGLAGAIVVSEITPTTTA